jgi:hypothetical protein
MGGGKKSLLDSVPLLRQSYWLKYFETSFMRCLGFIGFAM